MESDRFSIMLTLLTSQTIKEIAVRHNIPELEAARLFHIESPRSVVAQIDEFMEHGEPLTAVGN
jgi:hypothetical protein